MRQILASRLLPCILATLTAPVMAVAEPTLPVVAVLSSQTGPYREALAGLESELGAPIRSFILTEGAPKIPRATRVVIAFGSRAALRDYPDREALVYAMAPGTAVEGGDVIEICMEPDAAVLLANLKRVQPALKRLGVLWQAPKMERYIGRLRAAAAPLDVAIQSRQIADSSDMPDRLRDIYRTVDALWLPPDPLLLNANSLAILMEFSRSNHIPLFVPTSGLVAQGAIASVGPSFREMGRAAGIAVRKALENQPQENIIYLADVEVVINESAAAQIGLKISKEMLRTTDKVLP